MIVDSFAQIAFYQGLPERFGQALQWLTSRNLADLPLGKVDLEGDQLFVLVQEYSTKEPSSGRWEAHRRYADIQLIVTGEERVGVAGIDAMKLETPYDEMKDVAFFQGEGDWITLTPGRFAIFFPQDVHLPCIQANVAQKVRKIVVKVGLT
ncbi:MAG: YhcH/YjgK/YiaL family protein [Pirellulales bacterium]